MKYGCSQLRVIACNIYLQVLHLQYKLCFTSSFLNKVTDLDSFSSVGRLFQARILLCSQESTLVYGGRFNDLPRLKVYEVLKENNSFILPQAIWGK